MNWIRVLLINSSNGCPKPTHPREALYLGVRPGLVWDSIGKPTFPNDQYGPQSEVCDRDARPGNHLLKHGIADRVRDDGDQVVL